MAGSLTRALLPLATGGGDPAADLEAPNPVLPEPAELIWGSLAFAILLIGMIKFGFPAINKAMAARSDRIRNDLDEAESAKSQAQSVLTDYQRQLADAKAESNRIIEEARQQAERVKADMIANTNAEVAELKARASADIETARAAAISSLQGQVGAIAIELAEKVVEKNLDRETNQRLIEGFISRVGG